MKSGLGRWMQVVCGLALCLSLAGTLVAAENNNRPRRNNNNNSQNAPVVSQTQLTNLKKAVDDATKQNQTAQTQYDQAKKTLDDLQAKVADARARLEQAQKQLADVKERLTAQWQGAEPWPTLSKNVDDTQRVWEAAKLAVTADLHDQADYKTTAAALAEVHQQIDSGKSLSDDRRQDLAQSLADLDAKLTEMTDQALRADPAAVKAQNEWQGAKDALEKERAKQTDLMEQSSDYQAAAKAVASATAASAKLQADWTAGQQTMTSAGMALSTSKNRLAQLQSQYAALSAAAR